MNYVKQKLHYFVVYLIIFNVLLILIGFVAVSTILYAICYICSKTINILMLKK